MSARDDRGQPLPPEAEPSPESVAGAKATGAGPLAASEGPPARHAERIPEPPAPGPAAAASADVPEPDSAPARAEAAAAAADPAPPSLRIDSRLAVGRDAELEGELRRLSRRGFLTLGIGAAAAVAGWSYLNSRPGEDGVPWPFRRTLRANEALWRTLWDPSRLAPTYPRSAAALNPRVNGMLGLDRNADLATWHLAVEGAAAGALTLALADIQALPGRELITELRCVEGWNIIVHWTGVRLADFIARYPPATRDGSSADLGHPERLPQYLALETPGRGYYVGLDLASALHPQTLLAYAINDAPLSWEHGAPLRLVVPMKYGVKNLKRIGTLRYTDVRPTDFWGERGYDWYLGH